MNVSISISVPISDNKDRRNKYNTAILQLKENDIKLKINNVSEKEQLLQYTKQYNFNRGNYYYLIDDRKHLNDELETKETLLLSQKIIYREYNNTLYKYMSNELYIISDLST